MRSLSNEVESCTDLAMGQLFYYIEHSTVLRYVSDSFSRIIGALGKASLTTEVGIPRQSSRKEPNNFTLLLLNYTDQ